jgi:hypothetical protein
MEMNEKHPRMKIGPSSIVGFEQRLIEMERPKGGGIRESEHA